MKNAQTKAKRYIRIALDEDTLEDLADIRATWGSISGYGTASPIQLQSRVVKNLFDEVIAAAAEEARRAGVVPMLSRVEFVAGRNRYRERNDANKAIESVLAKAMEGGAS